MKVQYVADPPLLLWASGPLVLDRARFSVGALGGAGRTAADVLLSGCLFCRSTALCCQYGVLYIVGVSGGYGLSWAWKWLPALDESAGSMGLLCCGVEVAAFTCSLSLNDGPRFRVAGTSVHLVFFSAFLCQSQRFRCQAHCSGRECTAG